MPGPKKAQAQRVKGNLKPSSSSQAAQLLAAAGQSPVGFIGFSTQPAFVPASETFDDVDNSLDADFRLVLRKLSKKDTVTKIKALQELVSLCGNKKDEDIIAVVPFWPRIYNKVALDIDHKVRELSQKAMMVLANRAGKNMAPHLKSVMGAWIVSMCDSYPSVATAATSAFTGTFTAAKRTDAVRFCKEDLSNCLLTNILKHTTQTLSDPTTTSEEDMIGKYNRVVSSSLQGFRKLCTMLPSESVSSTMSPHFTTLLSDPAFWKHTKSTVPLVKGGLLNLLSSICQFCPEVSGQFVKKISPFVFSCLDMLDPLIVSHAWEALLSLINAHQDCWDHVNWQKAVWPKLKNLLEGGCCGMAIIIAPCFLPLLSKLPRENFMIVFDAMRLGLSKDCLVNNSSEMSAFVQAFVECIHYCIKHMLDSNSSKMSSLLNDQLLVVVEAGLTEEKPGLSRSPLFALLPSIITAVGTSHPEIEDFFWRDLSTFICAQLMACQHNLIMGIETDKNEQFQKFFLQRLVLLVQGIVFHQASFTTTKMPVRFAQHVAEKPSGLDASFRQKKTMSQTSQTLIADLLVMSFCMTDNYQASQFLSLFKNIVATHIPASTGARLIRDDDSVKCKLAEDFKHKGESKEDPEIESQLSQLLEDCQKGTLDEMKHLRNFLYSRLLRLLLYHQKQDYLDLDYTEELLMCMFSFLTYLPEDDGSKFLSATLQVLTSHLVTCQFIEQLLQRVNQIPSCRKAVESLGISARISELATEVMDKLNKMDGLAEIRKSTEPVWKMLSSVLVSLNEEEGQGDLFPPSCVDSIMTCCISSLKWLQQSSTATGCQSVSALTSLVQSLLDKQDVSFHSSFTDLLLSILSLVLSSSRGSGAVDELESAWSLCLNLITSQPSYVTQVCNFIRDWVCSHIHTVQELNRVSKVVRMMSVSKDDNDDGSNQTMKAKEDLDVPTVKSNNAVLDVIVSNPICVEEMEEVITYLYVEGSMSPATAYSNLPSGICILSMKSYALVATHNLRTISIGKKQVQGQERRAYLLSQVELECLAALAENVLIMDTVQKTHIGALNEFQLVLDELENGVLDLITSLTHQQLITLVDISLHRSASCLASIGIEKLLSKLLQSNFALHSTRAIKVGLRTLRTHFLNRLIIQAPSADEVVSLLKNNAQLTGSDISEAFTLTCSLILSLDTVDLNHITGCLAGFMSLLKDMDEMTHETKSVLFNQTLAMVKHLKEKEIFLLTGSDVHLADNVDHVHYNVCVARMINAAVLYQSHDYWDFVLCTLVEWLQFLTEVKVSDRSHRTHQALLVDICEVAHMAARTASSAIVVSQVMADTPAFAILKTVKTEWDEFFSEGIYLSLLPLFISLASRCLTSPLSDTWVNVLKPLASAASLCPPNLVSQHQLPARLSLTDSSALPDSLKTLLNHLCPLLNAKERHIGIAAFNILSSVIESIPVHENKAVSSSNKEEKEEDGEARMPPEAIVLVVDSNAIYLDFLMTVDIEVEVEMEPGSDEYAHATGYLLGWQLLLQLFKCSPNELRAKYAQYFKEQESVSHLLDHLIRLMPSNPTPSLLEFNSTLSAAEESKPHDLFSLALNVYRQCLEVIPALVRTWWVDQNRKTSNFVDRYTTDYLSNSLCWQQLTSPQMISSNIEDITIRARPVAREVIAVYQMAEVTINMTITLPKNYPLGKVDVVCDKRVGVSQAQWDRWLLQLNIFLQHQNGSVAEGLKLWKRNIDKKFEGIDDCMICFSVIHGTNFQLPRLTCRTCRKKFHSSCLYKWFNTSQKSSCPLCRNLF